MNPKNNRPFFMKDSMESTPNRKCLMCPTMLPEWIKYYCSGACMLEAKSKGIYGNETIN